MERPWLQLYTRDWLDCKELRRCSPAARGILTDLMCLAHEGIPYGYLSDKLGPLSYAFMASRCVVRPGVFRNAVKELLAAARLDENEAGLFIPRMVHDEEVRQKRAAGGCLGGNPNLTRKVNHTVNLPVKNEDNRPLTLTSDSDLYPKGECEGEPSEVVARMMSRHRKKDFHMDAERALAERLSELPVGDYHQFLQQLERKHQTFCDRLLRENTWTKYWPALKDWIRSKRDLDQEPDDENRRLTDAIAKRLAEDRAYSG